MLVVALKEVDRGVEVGAFGDAGEAGLGGVETTVGCSSVVSRVQALVRCAGLALSRARSSMTVRVLRRGVVPPHRSSETERAQSYSQIHHSMIFEDGRLQGEAVVGVG
ncbi:hypothetical protein [Streptomyces resistomycificus]|uniref:hypothetical protein n=1 Tax=Streptomyces resistomycificus TaxID=67356 RepID=UPI00069F8795|nr:hypothetical protein [Streptomyces resistomycificus]